MEGLLIFIGIISAIVFISWLNNRLSNLREQARKYIELKPRLDNLDNYSRELELKESELENKRAKSVRELESKEAQLESKRIEWGKKIQSDIKAIETLVEEKSRGFPWLAAAFADYFHLKDMKKTSYLAHKPHPALKAAEQVREVASQRRIAEKLHRILKYKLEYYENLFPWLVDFTREDVDELIIQITEKMQKGAGVVEEPEDKVVEYTMEGERKTLSRQELFQRALDRYWQKPKSKWEIGRDYERYIGYLYESRGYSVYYQGIVEGLADLGRDLICRKDNQVEIVQCKYWSKEKQIHEKHIFQLFGTVVAYRIDHPKVRVIPWFITSTILSETAKRFAKELDMKWTENYPLKPYPCIKCNVSRRDGAKIYHLPFDQQYDRTLVEEERNECYVETVKEAEALGFRRAFRWRGERLDSSPEQLIV